ncbi:MAG: aldo/keto reductase [Myxococcales bacterium]|nr:MAG: aldo/keto reductase [Myxococcales bacterium]
MNEIRRSSARVKLGNAGPEVFPIALGCMSMSHIYGPTDETESIATIHAALERGVSLLDTGDFYGMGHNELLLSRALAGKREQAILSVKFGALRAPNGAFVGIDTRPAAIKNFLTYSLTRLGTDYLDIYRPSRLDPNVPIEETMGALAELVKEGYVRAIGLSEVGADTLRRAAAVHPITDLQIEYSLISRGPETKIFPVLQELGASVTAYGVLSRGLLSGSPLKGPGDYRAHLPRFAGQAGEHNRKLVQALTTFAQERGLSTSQLAIAYVMSKGKHVVPVLGARTRKQLEEALSVTSTSLSAEDVTRVEAVVDALGVQGDRYLAAQMQHLDSER